MKKILLSGASGLVGRKLAEKLKQNGYNVEVLVRRNSPSYGFKSYVWDYENNYLEKGALDNVHAFIHLAGARISKRWTIKNRLEIYESRIDSLEFIFEQMKAQNCHPETVITASAIGYYGQSTNNHIYTEDDLSGTDFLSFICSTWEDQVKQFEKLGVRTVAIRTAAVLSKTGGFVEEIKKPLQYNMGVILGNGKQYLPWIHIDDLVSIYIKALEDKSINGPYNASAPDYVDNRTFTKKLASRLHKLVLIPMVPKQVLKLTLGNMSTLVTEGSRISPQKIINKGFKFKFETLDDAISDLF